ncbi:MAG: 4Fe-4S dicluster domain-containing protein, partial [Elusimicrobiota bacterium]|nr:4Fe-4S dicluster domain-containing protein [Elusimicrobiota bacterium]
SKGVFFKKIRKPVQVISAIAIFILLWRGLISIAGLMIVGSALGIILGKVFCIWMCPVGIIMELLLIAAPGKNAKGLYRYHKIGCPIAWISGLLNHVSILSVRHNKSKECVNCGLCDQVCYISRLNKSYSLYKQGTKSPENHFNCARCFECVDVCPTGYLSFGVRRPSDFISYKKKQVLFETEK